MGFPDGIRPRTSPQPTTTPTPPRPAPTSVDRNPVVPTPAAADTFVGPVAPAAGPAAATATSPQAAADRVDQARETLDDAGEAAREKEEELQTMLARVGPGLNPDQIADLRDSFRTENAAVYEAEEAAAAELAAALEDPAVDQETRIEGYQELAKSPSHAEEALEFARALAESDPELAATDEIQDLAATALENALPNIMANSPDAETALADLETYLGPLVRAGGGGKGVAEAYQALQATRAGDYDKLASLADKWDSKLSRSIGIAAVAIGAASAVGAAREGDYLRAVESLGSAGSKGIELLVGFSQSANRAALGVTSEAGVLGAAATRFAGGLAAVAAAAGFAQDLSAFLEGKGDAYAVAALGDLIAVAGGVSVATGIGAPIGAVLIAVGTVISGIGRFFGAQSERERIENDLRDNLERAGIPGDLAELYSKNFEEVGALAQAGWEPDEIQELIQSEEFEKYDGNVDQLLMLSDAGLTQSQIESFVNDNTEAFQEKDNIEAFLGFANANGIQPSEYNGFADRLRETEDLGEDWGFPLSQQYRQASGADNVGTGPTSAGTRDARLRAWLEDLSPAAHEYAVEHAPEVFDEDGQLVQEAQTDVDQLFNSGSPLLDVSFAQLVEEHKDDPDYLDAMVEYVRDEYDEEWVDFIRDGVELYEDGALEEFDEAVERTS